MLSTSFLLYHVLWFNGINILSKRSLYTRKYGFCNPSLPIANAVLPILQIVFLKYDRQISKDMICFLDHGISSYFNTGQNATVCKTSKNIITIIEVPSSANNSLPIEDISSFDFIIFFSISSGNALLSYEYARQ